MASGEHQNERPERDDDRDAAATTPEGPKDAAKAPERPPRTKGHISDYLTGPRGDEQDS